MYTVDRCNLELGVAINVDFEDRYFGNILSCTCVIGYCYRVALTAVMETHAL